MPWRRMQRRKWFRERGQKRKSHRRNGGRKEDIIFRSCVYVGGWWIHPTGCKLRLHTTPKQKINPNDKSRSDLFGGGWWIRTTEGVASRFTVCPLWPLGKSPILMKFTGAGGRTRTPDLLITNQLLYQLSYTST